MSSTGTPWIGAQSRTTYGGYDNGSSRRRRRGDVRKDGNSTKQRLTPPRTPPATGGGGAGDGDQRWPQDGGGRRASRARGVGEGRVGHLASARRARVASQARQAGVHSEGERKTARTRDSCHRRQGASSPGGRCAGTRVGGPVRIQIVWVLAGPRLPGRDAGDLRDRTRRVVSAPVGVGRGPGRRIRPNRSFPSARSARHVPREGDDRGLVDRGSDGPRSVRPDRAGQPAGRGDYAPNTRGNFCFDVTLSYRRLELPRRVPEVE